MSARRADNGKRGIDRNRDARDRMLDEAFHIRTRTSMSVDWLVEMNRFQREALDDRLAAAGHLDLALMSPPTASTLQSALH